MVRVSRSVFGNVVHITPEVIFHSQLRHPELKRLPQIENLIEATIAKPDIVVKGKYGESIAMKSLGDISLSTKYLVVPYEEGGEIKTAFITTKPERIRRREVLWRRL